MLRKPVEPLPVEPVEPALPVKAWFNSKVLWLNKRALPIRLVAMILLAILFCVLCLLSPIVFLLEIPTNIFVGLALLFDRTWHGYTTGIWFYNKPTLDELGEEIREDIDRELRREVPNCPLMIVYGAKKLFTICGR